MVLIVDLPALIIQPLHNPLILPGRMAADTHITEKHKPKHGSHAKTRIGNDIGPLQHPVTKLMIAVSIRLRSIVHVGELIDKVFAVVVVSVTPAGAQEVLLDCAQRVQKCIHVRDRVHQGEALEGLAGLQLDVWALQGGVVGTDLGLHEGVEAVE